VGFSVTKIFPFSQSEFSIGSNGSCSIRYSDPMFLLLRCRACIFEHYLGDVFLTDSTVRSLAERETDRLEAFSDGVFAFAITLLVLDLTVPPVGGSLGLFQSLLNEWPAFFALVTSFMTFLIMWVNHHNMFNYIRRVNREFMFLNGFLLLFVVLTRSPPLSSPSTYCLTMLGSRL